MKFKDDCVAHLAGILSGDAIWTQRMQDANRIHLAIFQEPYLTFIYDGKKTIETRFARRSCPPFRCVSVGDVVLLKSIGRGISGICTVDQVWFFDLDESAFRYIRERFTTAICPTDESFWSERQHARCATLILVGNVTRVPEFEVAKRDRRGWVVLHEDSQQLSFGFCRKDWFRQDCIV
jgi:hypothetical protein